MTQEDEIGTQGLPLILASRWRRLGGALIDFIISLVYELPLLVVTGAASSIFVRGEALAISQQATLFIFNWGFFLLLNGYLLLKRGQTIGKVILKMKIVDVRGNVPTFGKLLGLRYLAFWLVSQIPLLGVLVILFNMLCIFGKERRCLHDYLAGTRVVEA